MKHAALFNGIGGFQLAAQWMGWENVMSCEINKVLNQVTKFYYPNCTQHEDIRETDFTIYRGQIDILTGGFPCQPYSLAGKRLGKEDERHLWPEMLRAIGEIKPRFIVGENVYGLVNWNRGLVFDEVQADLAAKGYEVAPVILPACAVNAPHRRDRVWFVAKDTNGIRCNGSQREEESEIGGFGKFSSGDNERQPNEQGRVMAYATDTRLKSMRQKGKDSIHEFEPITNAKSKRLEKTRDTRKRRSGFENSNCNEGGATPNTNSSKRCEGGLYPKRPEETKRHSSTRNAQSNKRRDWENFPTQSPVCSGDDGLPPGLDGFTLSKWREEQIKAYGNAIVPQVAFEIFKAINKTLEV